MYQNWRVTPSANPPYELPDPKGELVKIAMSGKFLPFKYDGATGNAQAYGYKEE